jgi:hypothetical protein
VAVVSDDGPKVGVEEFYRTKDTESGQWLLGWRVENLTEQPVEFLSAWCPHGRFNSEERTYDPPLQARTGETATIEMPVRCEEPAGTVVENAFLILTTEWHEQQWRIFVRLRVVVSQEGVPGTAVELITTQRMGFSGVD